MAVGKSKRSRGDSQAAIFTAATHEFAERGLDAVEDHRIAARARVNKAMIYSHYRSKLGPYLEVLRTSRLSCGLYRLRRGEEDQQRPHREEEVYLVMEGRGRFRMGDQDYAAEPGALLAVPARVEHGFHSITEDLLLLVFFAPAEGTSE